MNNGNGFNILLSAMLDIRKAIIELLSDGAMIGKDICNALPIVKPTEIQVTLRTLRAQGHIRFVNSQYELIPTESPDWRPAETLPEDYYAF